jgi:hypothetical protein
MGALVTTERGDLFARAAKHTLIPHVEYMTTTDDGEVLATVLYRGFIVMFQGALRTLEATHTFSAKHAVCQPWTIDFCAAMVRNKAGL